MHFQSISNTLYTHTVCGDDICSSEIGETCDTCETDCCIFIFPVGAIAAIVIFVALIPIVIFVVALGVRLYISTIVFARYNSGIIMIKYVSVIEQRYMTQLWYKNILDCCDYAANDVKVNQLLSHTVFLSSPTKDVP